MNAFTRQEITAVHLARSRHPAAWKSEQLPGRQEITYLPVVDARSTRIVGYQVTAGSKSGAFDCLRMQIMNSPASGILLVELDADCLKNGRCHANYMCALFSQEAWTERELVIHLRLHRHSPDWQAMQMQKRLQALGIDVAVSWDGCFSLLALDALIDARVIRFKASALEPERRISESKAMAQVLQIAKRLGIQTMLAGVSDGEQMEKARKLGFDWLQGPLFNRLKVCG